MPSLRTPEGKKRYQEYMQNEPAAGSCALCERKALKTFTHWKIVDNLFPYDLIASSHHMLVPIRHVIEAELTAEEFAEVGQIKTEYLNEAYDWLIEATPKNKTIPAHFHVHLIIAKQDQ